MFFKMSNCKYKIQKPGSNTGLLKRERDLIDQNSANMVAPSGDGARIAISVELTLERNSCILNVTSVAPVRFLNNTPRWSKVAL